MKKMRPLGATCNDQPGGKPSFVCGLAIGTRGAGPELIRYEFEGPAGVTGYQLFESK